MRHGFEARVVGQHGLPGRWPRWQAQRRVGGNFGVVGGLETRLHHVRRDDRGVVHQVVQKRSDLFTGSPFAPIKRQQLQDAFGRPHTFQPGTARAHGNDAVYAVREVQRRVKRCGTAQAVAHQVCLVNAHSAHESIHGARAVDKGARAAKAIKVFGRLAIARKIDDIGGEVTGQYLGIAAEIASPCCTGAATVQQDEVGAVALHCVMDAPTGLGAATLVFSFCKFAFAHGRLPFGFELVR